MNKFFRGITKELGVNITAFDVPYERIEQNLSLDLKKCRSKSTILEHITKVERQFPHLKKKQLKEKFSNEELRKKLSIILPDLEKNCDSRLKHLLKSNGPFCKIVVKKTHKHHLKKAKGVYFFYNKKTLEPLYIGVAKGSYTRLMSYFSITPSNCMYNGQGTTVRINILINEIKIF